jgi:hypothetical protein
MINQETIQGERLVLQPATPEDERQILDWLLRSDVTPSLLGPPLFPERPLPPPEDSGERFDPHYLDGTAPELGRCFLILVDGEPAGQVTYSRTRRRNSSPDYPHPDPIVLLERFPKLFVVGDAAIRVVYDEENPCPLVTVNGDPTGHFRLDAVEPGPALAELELDEQRRSIRWHTGEVRLRRHCSERNLRCFMLKLLAGCLEDGLSNILNVAFVRCGLGLEGCWKTLVDQGPQTFNVADASVLRMMTAHYQT